MTEALGRARVRWAGDRALRVELAREPGPEATRRVLAVAEALADPPLPALREVVPAHTTLWLILDPWRLPDQPEGLRGEVARRVAAALGHPPGSGPDRAVLHTVEVVYGGADGPDLEEVAREVGLSPDAVVQRHAAVEYTVLAVGFRPGFAYLGMVDPSLRVGRLAQPRLSVPAGSVGLAGGQTCVYPGASAGGWRLIGRTSARLFDPTAPSPAEACRLRPGDRVRFRAVGA